MLGLLLVLAGTTEPLAQLDLREERAVLLAADSAFAVHASRALLPAFRDVLDEDVIFLDPGERMLFGKPATLAMLGSDGISAAATQDWRAVRVDVSSDGGAGYTYGFGGMTGPLGPGGAARSRPTRRPTARSSRGSRGSSTDRTRFGATSSPTSRRRDESSGGPWRGMSRSAATWASPSAKRRFTPWSPTERRARATASISPSGGAGMRASGAT